jgi:hypothetical protein
MASKRQEIVMPFQCTYSWNRTKRNNPTNRTRHPANKSEKNVDHGKDPTGKSHVRE